MTKLANNIPVFYDGRGVPLTGGYVSVGAANGDPENAPINVYWDEGFTVRATQPLRTIGGMIVNGVTPASVFFTQQDYSVRVTDANGVLVAYSPSVYSDADSFQTKNDTLTEIAGQGATDFGLALLLLRDQAALQAAVASLPGFTKTTDFSSGVTASGSWEQRPDGAGGYIITQRGFGVQDSTGGTKTITFPVPFTDASSIVAVASNASGGVPAAFHGTGSYTETTMVVGSSLANGSAAGSGTTFTWQATGR